MTSHLLIHTGTQLSLSPGSWQRPLENRLQLFWNLVHTLLPSVPSQVLFSALIRRHSTFEDQRGDRWMGTSGQCLLRWSTPSILLCCLSFPGQTKMGPFVLPFLRKVSICKRKYGLFIPLAGVLKTHGFIGTVCFWLHPPASVYYPISCVPPTAPIPTRRETGSFSAECCDNYLVGIFPLASMSYREKD